MDGDGLIVGYNMKNRGNFELGEYYMVKPFKGDPYLIALASTNHKGDIFRFTDGTYLKKSSCYQWDKLWGGKLYKVEEYITIK